MHRHAVIALLILCPGGPAIAGNVVHVDADAPPGGDGTSWATAHRFLLNAMAFAGNGDEIRVAEGVYRPDQHEALPGGSGSRLSSFNLFNGVKLLGGYAGLGAPDPDLRDPVAHVTTLDGDLAGDDLPGFGNRADNSYHVIRAANAGATTVLEGFTIRGGQADDALEDEGGGLLAIDSSLAVRDCTFVDCFAQRGGGAWLDDGAATFEDCGFHDNAAEDEGGSLAILEGATRVCDSTFTGGTAAEGGALSNQETGTLHVGGCTFEGNTARTGGAIQLKSRVDVTIEDCLFAENGAVLSALHNNGGAIHGPHTGGALTVRRCTFLRNVASPSFTGEGGGAIKVFLFGSEVVLSISGCRFEGNTSGYDAGAISISSDDSQLAIENSVFVGNTTVERGGALTTWPTVVTSITNCTFVENHAAQGSAWYKFNGTGSARNCIFRDDGATTLGGNSVAPMDYCNVDMPVTGVGNIDAAPIFERDPDPGPDGTWGTPDDDYGDLRPAAGSPGIDAGDTTAPPPCMLDAGGHARFVDDPATPDTGVGGPPVVDIGAHEYGTVPADCNDNAIADDCENDCNFNDLPDACDITADPSLDVNVNGVIDGCEALGDVNGDGVVAVDDLVMVIVNWGPCPPAPPCFGDVDFDGDVDVEDLMVVITGWSG